MPDTQQKQQITFDKNIFTLTLMGARAYGHVGSFNRLITQSFNNLNPYDGPKNPEELETFCQHFRKNGTEHDANLVQYEYEIYKNPHGDFAQSVREYWNFMRYIFMERYDKKYINNYSLILNKIDTFDSNVQIVILQKMWGLLRSCNSQDLKRAVAAKMVSINDMPLNDRIAATRDALVYVDQNVVRDIIEELKQELSEELNKDMPDFDKIRYICVDARNIAQTASNALLSSTEVKNIKNPINRDYVNTVRSFFDEKTIVDGTDTNYVRRFEEDLLSRVTTAEEQRKDAEQRANKAETRAQYAETTLKSKQEEFETALKTEKEKNTKLTKELDALQGRVTSLEDLLKRLKLEIAKLKVGLFSSNKDKIAQIQQIIENHEKPDHTH